MDIQLSEEARRVLAWFTPTKTKGVNGNIEGNVKPYRELVDAGLLTEKPLPEGWFEYQLKRV